MEIALHIEDFAFTHVALEGACAPAGIGPLSWDVPQGAFCVLTGVTGSGKTTLLRCCKPEVAPQGSVTGEILVFGRPLAQLDPRESATTIGYVAQNPETQIVCDSVWHELAFALENIGLPQEEMRRRIAEISHFFGIGPWFRQQTASLSGGQKQLMNMAAALTLRPRILLLDEPTSQLDPVAEKDFLHALFRVNRELGITVIVATHNPGSMAAYATEGVVLDAAGIHPLALAEGGELPALTDERRRACLEAQQEAIDNPIAWTEDVHVRYSRTGAAVLRGTDVHIGRGTIHGLVGGNGCGKTTLLKTFAGLLKPYRGRVRNAGMASQAYLPQNPKTLLVCDTVWDELQEWRKAGAYGDDEIRAMLEFCGLAGLEGRHPYDLSGGQQQMLALAKVLLPKPTLLLLDEPTKGLDDATKLKVAQVFARLSRQGVTIVFATHDLAFSYCVAHTMTMLFDGEVASTQPVGDFFAQNLFFKPLPDGFTRLWGGAEMAGEQR